MIHENSSQAETHGIKLYSVTYSTWNSSFSDLNRHSILAVGNGAEDAIQRTKEMVERDARDFRAEEISDVMGFRIYTGASIGQERMGTPVEQFTGAVRLTLVTAKQSCPLALPASDECLEQVRSQLGLGDFAEAAIDDIQFSTSCLAELIPLDAITVEEANKLAQCIQQMEQEDVVGKFCAALEVEQPATFTEAVRIAMDRDDYESVPEDMDGYGKQVLRRIGADDEIIATIDGYMDFSRLGEDSLAEDGVRRTEFGLVRRLSTPFTDQQEQGMQMQ